MSTLFNLSVKHKEKEVSHHPWEKTIKDEFSNKIKHAHNSINNPHYPEKKKGRIPYKDRVKFTVIGNRVTSEFIYCVNLVKGLHKYRWRSFDVPVIRGVTGVEWPTVWNELKIQYGGLAYCLTSQVGVLYNDKFLGGINELKDLIKNKYVYHICLNYPKESVQQFAGFIKSSGRPCAYLHISIDSKPIGSLIFMLYADIVPNTCENFLRLCKTRKGGYGGTPVHRIVKDCWIQCGGYGLKRTDLDCENFIVPHDRRGVLGMANDGRHVDCSTQFFVLLQPAPWMANKYVAFGQLIDGEATLAKIESVTTWYEAPTSNITIYNTGIVNLECQDISINKHANEYIQGHIEDLVTIGELFTQLLMERVFLEIEFRRIQRLDQQAEGEGDAEGDTNKDIRATQRFMRRKEEIQKQLEKSVMDSHRPSSGVTETSKATKEENNDFDVENYAYEPEEYSYQQASVGEPSLPPKQEKPFYIALTDVPYPGEVDSTYDLKKFLKGDYCLESDLAKSADKKNAGARKASDISDVYNYMDEMKENISDTMSAEQELDSDEEQEIKKYLKNHVDRVSFAGGIVKGIAKAQIGMQNLFQNQRKSELVTDDQLRRFRLASVDMRERDFNRKVSISAPSWEKKSKEIKRRQTGFVRPEDLEKIRVISRRTSAVSSDDEDEDDDTTGAKVQINQGDYGTPKTPTKQLRRPTAFVRPSEMPTFDEDEDDDEGEPHVQIDPATEQTHPSHFKRRPTTFVRPGAFNIDDIDDEDDEDDKDKEVKEDQEDEEEPHVQIDPTTEATHPSHFKRRPTTFVRPGMFNVDDEDDDDDADDEDDDKKGDDKGDDDQEEEELKVRIEATSASHDQHFKRRATTFVRPGSMPIDDDDEDDSDDDEDKDVDLTPKSEDASKVQIVEPDIKRKSQPIKRRPTTFVRPGSIPVDSDDEDDDDDGGKVRPSLLARLYEDAKIYESLPAPTLKNYRPLSELQHKNILLTQSPIDHIRYDDGLVKDKSYIRQSMQVEDSFDQILNMQHGKKLTRKISSDYVNTIEHMENRKAENSIRSVEYARTRPFMTVSEYQLKNQKTVVDKGPLKVPSSTSMKSSKKSPYGSRKSRGLRLPGDSPLYSQHEFDNTDMQNLEVPSHSDSVPMDPTEEN